LFSICCIQCFKNLPFKPKKCYNDLNNTKLLKKELSNLRGVYGIIHIKSSKQYIGSSINLYARLMDHIKGRRSNIRLQRSIKKYNLKSFKIVIYFFYLPHHKNPTILLKDIETIIISAFPFSSLFNFKKRG
jgi:group I intron endonuclease